MSELLQGMSSPSPEVIYPRVIVAELLRDASGDLVVKVFALGSTWRSWRSCAVGAHALSLVVVVVSSLLPSPSPSSPSPPSPLALSGWVLSWSRAFGDVLLSEIECNK